MFFEFSRFVSFFPNKNLKFTKVQNQKNMLFVEKGKGGIQLLKPKISTNSIVSTIFLNKCNLYIFTH